MRIAIIGAGAAGLCAGRHALSAHFEVVLFEQTSDVGGTWVYTDRVDKDEYGLPIHSSMYKGLRTNIPKEIMSYPDYPLPENPSSYLPGEAIKTYLEAFADDFHVREHVRFRHEVIRVRPISRSSQWEVIVRDLVADRHETLQFDAVIVCNGHFSEPKIPEYAGFDQYNGHYVHSKDYRDFATYKNKSVLIVGMGPSGIDIALMTSTVASRVVVSYHKSRSSQALPNNIHLKPNIRHFTETDVEFVDGSVDTFDEIIFCTGYKYTYPFLSVDSGITVEEDSFVRPLFKHCINIEHPTMLLPGLVFRVCQFQVIDVQVRFFLAFLGGRRSLPTRSEMLSITAADMEKSWALNGEKRMMHQLATLQEEYYNDLSTIGGVENIKPYVLKIYDASQAYRKTHAINYRSQTFRIIDDHNFTSGVLDDETPNNIDSPAI